MAEPLRSPTSPRAGPPPSSGVETRTAQLPRARHRPVGTVIKGFLGRHPILCLVLLSPGIPEYLSSSSPLSTLLVNPGIFFLQLAANVGLYLPGVLLIREAMIRWQKGWGSVLLLGAAYGILEEGIVLETLFYARAGPVGVLGSYGHWLGVNWVWIPGVLLVHMLLSISLPILLLGLALPGTHGRSLVGRRGISLAFLLWAVDLPLLALFVHAVYRYWMGWPIFFSSLLAIAALVFVAYVVPARLMPRRSGPPRVAPLGAALMGASIFPALWLLEGALEFWRAPPWSAILLIVSVEGALGFLIVWAVGSTHHEPQLVALAGGMILPIAVLGFAVELPIPVTIIADGVAVWFLRYLWTKYSPAAPVPAVPVPPGARAFG